MADIFIPFAPAAVTPEAAPFTPFGRPAPATAPNAVNVASQSGHPPTSENCGQPIVTLQRIGEVVTGIRIQCTCGQVIELACT